MCKLDLNDRPSKTQIGNDLAYKEDEMELILNQIDKLLEKAQKLIKHDTAKDKDYKLNPKYIKIEKNVVNLMEHGAIISDQIVNLKDIFNNYEIYYSEVI